MRLRSLLAALALFPSIALAQATIQLSGSKLLDNNGNPLAAGKIVLTVTDASGTPVTYTPQGGSPSTAPYVDTVVNGAVQYVGGFPFQLLNTLTASPSGLVFHYQIESTDGSVIYLDVPKWNITSTTGGYSLDSLNVLAGWSITGLGYPRTRCSPTAKYTPSDNPIGAKPWICSNLWRSDKTNQWTQNPSSNPNCPMGQAIVSPQSGPTYCILPENAYALPGEGFTNPDPTFPGPIQIDPIASGGAHLPNVLEMISGLADGSGNGVGMPEKGTAFVAGSPNTAKVAWNEDMGLGLFDCRDSKYDGGCLGTTPGLAMQDLATDLICFNTATGLKANVIFPCGTITIGTAANPTLKLPTGNRYFGACSGITGRSTLFNATYNNKSALEFDANLTATCSGSGVTDTLTDGAYVGFGVHGCGQGGCVNVPGDSTTYGTGGPAQTGITIGDSQGWVDLVGADHNGADGVIIGGIDTHTGNLWGNSNNDYYYFGKSVGPAYNPSTDGVHCNICLNSLDGMFDGPNETYGFINDPGVEYGHAVEVFVGGGMTQADHIFVNRGTIGVQRGLGDGSSFGGHISHMRIDGTTGPGILAKGASDWFNGATITNACGSAKVGWSSVASVAIATAGSGQTPGTYNLTGSGGLATTGGIAGNGGQAGTNAIIQVVVAAGGTVTAAPTVSNTGAKYNATPTFTLAAGGTPATFTVTMAAPLAQSGTSDHTGFCDSVEDISAGGDHFAGLQSQFSFSFGFGPDYATGGVWPFGGGEYAGAYGFYETPGTEQTGQGANIHPQINYPQSVTGTAPDVEFGGVILPSDSSATNIATLSRPWIGEQIDIVGGDANDTLISTLNGGNFQTCSGYNINLALPQTWHFVVTQAFGFGNAIIKENCNSVDQNHWWVNHAANTASLPPLVQQGAVDSMGDIRAHALPALPALLPQAGGTPGANGVGGTYVYAYRVWGVWGTQTSITNTITQCLPLAGFVNNPCFQDEGMRLPEGWTRYILTRESSTDGTATAGTIADVSATTPQHATTVTFADTRIAPINANIIGSANYAANETGGVAGKCGVVPPVSAYPGVQGQMCDDPVGGFRYYADSTDHWQRTTATYANF